MDDTLFLRQLERLEEACNAEADDMKRLVASIIPTYCPRKGS
jgi:hypothetical protein